MFREKEEKMLESYEYKKLLWETLKEEIEKEKKEIKEKIEYFQEGKTDDEKIAFESELNSFIETFFSEEKMLIREKKLDKMGEAYKSAEELKIKIFKSFYNKKVTVDFLIKYDQNEAIMKEINFPRDLQYVYLSENAFQLTPSIFGTGGQHIKLSWDEKITYKENINRTLKVAQLFDKESTRIQKEYWSEENKSKREAEL